MTQHSLLIEALGDVAYSTTRDDWRTAINRLRIAVAPRTSKYRPLGRRLFLDHRQARSLLDFAADVGEQVHRRKRKERPARRAPLERAVICNEPDLPVRFPFVMRPAIDEDGRGRLEVVGPKHADGEFIIHYAFWLAASAAPVTTWRTFKLRECPVCGEPYRDGRVWMRGGLLRRCRDCLAKDGRKRK